MNAGRSRPQRGLVLFAMMLLATLVWSVSAATHQRPVQQAEMIEWQSIAEPPASAPASGAATP